MVFLTSYEIAFSHSPDSLKAVASAMSLVVSSLSNFITAFMFELFQNQVVELDEGDKSSWHLPDGRSGYVNFFSILICVCSVGVVGPLLFKPYYDRVIRPTETAVDVALSLHK